MHNHGAETAKIIRGKAIHDMRRLIQRAPTQPVKSAYDSVANSKSSTVPPPSQDDARVLTPAFESVNTILKRQRSCTLPKLPKTREEIVLEGEWTETVEGERFLLPVGSTTNDMLIFVSDDNLTRLAECKTLYMDGTFKTCPGVYAQFFSFHGLVNEHVVPLVYVLLSDKTAATYYRLFGTIRDAVFKLGAVLDPKVILSDFESGLIEAVRSQFPGAKHAGCHFHYTQAVWRKVQHLGLVTAYNNSQQPEIAEFIQLCMALAFIPEVEIVGQFEQCIADLSAENAVVLREFIQYFRDTWVSGLFNRSMWNKYGEDYLHRTNNRVESWHSNLKKTLPIHPNIYIFVSYLKKIQSGAKLTLLKADAGESPKKRRQKYVNFESAITKVHKQHENGDISTSHLLRKARHFVRKYK